MSGLVAFALGLSAQQALLGKTWAAANVLFEPVAPVDPVSPVIAIYAGRGHSRVEGRDVLNALSSVTLRFEVAVPATVAADGLTFSSDSAQSLVFACIWRQIETVFLQDQGTWADLWRRCIQNIDQREGARDLFENAAKQKLPVAIEEWRLEALAEPAIGQAPQGFWADFVAALTGAGGELAQLATLIAAQVQGSTSVLEAWQTDMSILGATADEMAAIGLGDTPDDVTTATDGFYVAPPVETVTVSANDDDLVGQS